MAINIGYEGSMIGTLGYQAYQMGQGERRERNDEFALKLATLQQHQQQIDQRNAIATRERILDTYNRHAQLKQREQQFQAEIEQRQRHDQNQFDLKNATFSHDFEMISKKAEAENLKIDNESQRRYDELKQYDSQIDEAVSKKVITPDEAQEKKYQKRQQAPYQRTPSFVPYNYDAKKFMDQNTIDIDGVKYHVDPKTGTAKLANKEAIDLEIKKKELDFKAQQHTQDVENKKLDAEQKIMDHNAKILEAHEKRRDTFAQKYADRKEMKHDTKHAGKENAPAFDYAAALDEGESLFERQRGGTPVPQPTATPAPPAQQPATPPTATAQTAPALPPDVAPQVQAIIAQTAPDFGNDRLAQDVADAVKQDKQVDKANPGKSFVDKVTSAYKRWDSLKVKSAKGLSQQELAELTEQLNILRPYLKRRQ